MYLHIVILITTTVTFCRSSSACPTTCESCGDGKVMCAGAGLTAPPTTVSEDTYSVDFSQNSIISLRTLPAMPKVESMRMSMNKVSVIPNGIFTSSPLIMSLDLSMNEIHTIQDNGFKGLDDLLSISLNGNQITTIGRSFAKIKSVTSIRLGNNKIREVKDEHFMHNTMVKMLDLSNNQINTIEANAFGSLDMLRYLILSNNPIKQLPQLKFTSTMLWLADFSNCLLEHVPRKMPPSLKDLRLGNNKITKIFREDLSNITQLNLLTLNDNQISNVEHRSFMGLENLKELWMSRNKLVYIPRGLPKNLAKFHLDNNQVVEFQPTMFVEGSALKHLSLEANSMQKIHKDALKNVRELEHLNLQGNRLNYIEAGTFTHQPVLKSLKLTNNPIQVFLEGAFSGLNSLTELSLSYIDNPIAGNVDILKENFLNAMPNVITIDLMSSIHLTKKLLELFAKTGAPVMPKVTTLNLQYNELTTLPKNIKNLFPNVQNLWLDGNLFICDTKLRWLHQWTQQSSINFYQLDEPTCDVPLALKGKPFSEISTADFKEIPKDETVHVIVPQSPVEANVQETPKQENRDTTNADTKTASSNTNEVGKPTSDSARQDTHPTSNNQAKPHTGSSPNRQNRPVSQPNNNQQHAKRYNPQSPSKPVGVKVVIKPPRNTGNTQTRRPNTRKPQKNKMTKAQRKAAREAAKARRKAERAQKKLERQNARRRRHQQAKNARRKKRRIRSHRKKRCQLDADGKMKCRKRKRCMVDADGHVKCRKRNHKKATNTEKKSNTLV